MPRQRVPESSPANLDQQWWQPRTVAVDQTLHCKLGPLDMRIGRAHSEWRLAWTHGEESDDAQRIVLEASAGLLAEDAALERYAVANNDGQVRLRPMLLDRPVVMRPRLPLFIPAGESTTLFISTPVVAVIEVGASPILLRALPTVRLSDTWFGPSSRDGELCYSSQTRARSRVGDIPQRQHRATTPVHIENQADSTLPVEKLSLPVPALSLYGNAQGHLWTERLLLSRRDDTDLAVLRIESSAPEVAGPVERVASPGQAAPRGGLVRAFHLFFGD